MARLDTLPHDAGDALPMGWGHARYFTPIPDPPDGIG